MTNEGEIEAYRMIFRISAYQCFCWKSFIEPMQKLAKELKIILIGTEEKAMIKWSEWRRRRNDKKI